MNLVGFTANLKNDVFIDLLGNSESHVICGSIVSEINLCHSVVSEVKVMLLNT